MKNEIHTFAGVQLRLACEKMMAAQGYEEPTGRAKITPSFTLPRQLCSSYSGTYCQGLAYEKRTGRVSFLLSFLPGTG